MCEECYATDSRATPILKPLDCLRQHTQYICGTCGRCICIEHDPKRKLQRWNFPFSSLEIAKLYIRVADVTMKKACGIYELQQMNGRISYKIFSKEKELLHYLKQHQDRSCKTMKPVYKVEEFKEYPNSQIRKLTSDEIQLYLKEQENTR